MGLRHKMCQPILGLDTTDSIHCQPVFENVLSRDFTAFRPGEKWVSDITYLRTLCDWVYLTVIIDLYDRKVIGWALGDNLEASASTVSALKMAVTNRLPRKGLIFHCDRGVQYCCQLFVSSYRSFVRLCDRA